MSGFTRTCLWAEASAKLVLACARLPFSSGACILPSFSAQVSVSGFVRSRTSCPSLSSRFFINRSSLMLLIISWRRVCVSSW